MLPSAGMEYGAVFMATCLAAAGSLIMLVSGRFGRLHAALLLIALKFAFLG
jgi:xanthine/uracil/vitamin C permease (AzgA family)